MKTRENELHELKVTHTPWRNHWNGHYKFFDKVEAFCPICNLSLYENSFQTPRGAIVDIIPTDYDIPNYCPNCGARLKEIEE